METLLLTTFSIIIAFSLINALINFFSYLQSPEPIYKISALFWITLIANFFIQGVAQDNQSLIILSFSFSLLPVNLLCLSLHEILEERFYTRFIAIFSLSMLVLSSVFSYFKLGFTTAALPLSFAAAVPLAITSYKLYEANRNQWIFKFIGFVLALFLLHGFNFAFFRMDGSTQIWGWLIAYALYQAIAALLPIATLAEFHYRESARMQAIIKNQTADLAEANRNLKNSISFKDFLFRTLAHDIATPLVVSSASLTILKNTRPDLITDPNLSRLDNSIHKMIQISNDLKQVENKNLEIVECGAYDCITSAIDALNALLESKKQQIIYDKHELESIGIYVHKTSFINSVLGNLLRNSIKFSPKESEIKIKAWFSNGYSYLSITNLGLDIPEETLNSIFDFNFEKTRLGTEGEKGTGWGLPICNAFLEKYGASISLYSRPNKKSDFATIEALIKLKGFQIAREQLNVG